MTWDHKSKYVSKIVISIMESTLEICPIRHSDFLNHINIHLIRNQRAYFIPNLFIKK